MASWQSMFRSLFGRDPNAELKEQIERQALEMQRRLLEGMAGTPNVRPIREAANYGPAGPNWLPNIIDPSEPLFDDPQFWTPLFAGNRLPPTLDKTKRGELLPIYINWYGLKVIRDISRRICVGSEYAINVIENRINYTCGRGYQYKIVPKDGHETADVLFLCRLAQKWIDAFTSGQKWNEMEQEAIKRCDRDGEAFIRFFHVGNGYTEVRFIEPEWVKSMSDEDWQTYGIVNAQGDVGDILGFMIMQQPPYVTASTFVPAEEVLHIKGHIASDSNTKRGLPIFYSVRKNIIRAETLQQNMSVLASVQATFALIRTHKGYSVSSMQQFQQNNADVQWSNPYNGNQQYAKQYAAGTIIDSPEGMSYSFPSASVNAGAFVAILDSELRSIGAAVQMPEFMVGNNSSNQNFASIQVTESPFVKAMERHQSFFSRRFGHGSFISLKSSGAIWRAISNACKFGGLPREVMTLCELQVEGHSLIGRDKLQETQRAALLNQAQILSKPTWSKWEGLDREQEEKLINNDIRIQLAQQAIAAQAQLQQQMQAQRAQAELQLQTQQAQANAQLQNQAAGIQQQAAQQQAAQQPQQQDLSQPQSPQQQQELAYAQGLPELPQQGQREIQSSVDVDVYVDWILADPFARGRQDGIVFSLNELIESGFSGGVRDRLTGERTNYLAGSRVQWTREEIVVEKLKIVQLREERARAIVEQAMRIKESA